MQHRIFLFALSTLIAFCAADQPYAGKSNIDLVLFLWIINISISDQQTDLQLQDLLQPDLSRSIRSVQLEDDFANEKSVVLTRNRRDLFGIADVVSGVISGATGVLDAISSGLSAVGSFLNISWLSDFFVGIINVISTVLKVVQGVLGLLSLSVLIGEILLNLYYIVSYLLTGNLFAVVVYVVNVVIAIATYPS